MKSHSLVHIHFLKGNVPAETLMGDCLGLANKGPTAIIAAVVLV